VAATGRGDVCIWRGGIAAGIAQPASPATRALAAAGLSPFGYDHDGNLIGVGTTGHRHRVWEHYRVHDPRRHDHDGETLYVGDKV
jgi:hypothetical protein